MQEMKRDLPYTEVITKCEYTEWLLLKKIVDHT